MFPGKSNLNTKEDLLLHGCLDRLNTNKSDMFVLLFTDRNQSRDYGCHWRLENQI